MTLIQPLPSENLDIIGDVHGHFEALQNLIHHLGYSHDGTHPQNRKLIFIGDLIDRGPNSPAVLEWFQKAHHAKNAFMVLGNHEINLLTNEIKDGSGWFFEQRSKKDDKLYAPWKKLAARKKQQILDFLSTQPLALERDDLRIVHAAWLPKSIEILRTHHTSKLLEIHHNFHQQIQSQLKSKPWINEYKQEQSQYEDSLENPNITPPMLHATAEHETYLSQAHPIRALTCGIEKTTLNPFFASGRWRFTNRMPWWDDYQDEIPVIVGHYWRQWKSDNVPNHRKGLFTIPSDSWHGAKNNVFCCDFSVGARWRDKEHNIPPQQSEYRLAALRWPEKTLVFDNEKIAPTKNYATAP